MVTSLCLDYLLVCFGYFHVWPVQRDVILPCAYASGTAPWAEKRSRVPRGCQKASKPLLLIPDMSSCSPPIETKSSRVQLSPHTHGKNVGGLISSLVGAMVLAITW